MPLRHLAFLVQSLPDVLLKNSPAEKQQHSNANVCNLTYWDVMSCLGGVKNTVLILYGRLQVIHHKFIQIYCLCSVDESIVYVALMNIFVK